MYDDRIFQFNSIESVFKYNIWLKALREYAYDSQALNQVGTDKDYITVNPDIAPEVQVGMDDTNCIWISWSGNNANAGTQANPKRSFLDGKDPWLHLYPCLTTLT